MSKNKRCVFVADTQAAAQGISHWLDRYGIENLLIDKTTLGMSNGVSFTSNDPSSDGWQVWIKDPDRIEEALELLDERRQVQDKKSKMAPVNATCEECGATSEFTGSQRGSIQDCPKCGKFMDVGGLEEEFEWPDSF